MARDLTNDFRVAVKLHPTMRCYEIAQAANINPCTLSKLLNGIEQSRENDPRIIAVAKAIGFPVERCFTENGSGVTHE